MSTGNDLIRIQCGFVDTPEVEAICEFIGSQQGYPDAFILPEYTPEGNSESGNLKPQHHPQAIDPHPSAQLQLKPNRFLRLCSLPKR